MDHCPSCGCELKNMAAILEQPVIEKILEFFACAADRCFHKWF
jgi:hypothetical protein